VDVHLTPKSAHLIGAAVVVAQRLKGARHRLFRGTFIHQGHTAIVEGWPGLPTPPKA